MNDETQPQQRTKRISLTKTQLRTELGAELLSLCQSVTADGKIAPEEVEGLRSWLADADAAELPAASYLREVVERILADGQITPDEYKELHKAVESVLPSELRKDATAARKSVADAERAAVKAAKEAEREERRRNAPLASANFMVAGVRHDGRQAVIERHANPGDAVTLQRDRGNRFSKYAVAVVLANGKQIGFVPEDDAQELAALLDQGARADAVITKILGGGRSLIPVVQTYLYRADAQVSQSLAADSGWLKAKPASASSGSHSNSGLQFKTVLRWLLLAVFVWVAYKFAFGRGG